MSIASAARRVARLLAEHKQKVVFAESCTGGLVAGALTKIPGISAHHCGGMVVYRNETKMAYLGISAEVLKKPGPVSEEVARQMATRVLEKTPEATLAAAVTGHLGPDAPKRLDGVVYIAVARRAGHESEPACQVQRLKLPAEDDRATRQKQTVEAVLEAVAESLAAEQPHVCSPDCAHHHHHHVQAAPANPPGGSGLSAADWDELVRGEVHALCLGGPEPTAGQPTSGAIFPGSFHPLHAGHKQMAAVAEKLLGVPVEYALSIVNVDKPPLSRREVLRRAKQFRPDQAVWVVGVATFVELATLFPDTTFLVGADTIARVGDAKYYDDDPRMCRDSLKYLAEQGARFLVFGRTIDGQFQTLADLKLPAALRKLCRGVGEREFRVDTSSRDLRN